MTEQVEKKELLIRNSSKYPSCYEIFFENGGELPKELRGGYTNKEKAQKAIDDYLNKRESKRGGKRGATASKSRTE